MPPLCPEIPTRAPTLETCPAAGTAAEMPLLPRQRAQGSQGAPSSNAGPVRQHMGAARCMCSYRVPNTRTKITSEQNFQGSADVFPCLAAPARHSHKHTPSQSRQSTNPLEAAELSPACSAALDQGEASTSGVRRYPTCPSTTHLLASYPISPSIGEIKGSPSSHRVWLQGRERVSHHPGSTSELQAHQTWVINHFMLGISHFAPNRHAKM